MCVDVRGLCPCPSASGIGFYSKTNNVCRSFTKQTIKHIAICLRERALSPMGLMSFCANNASPRRRRRRPCHASSGGIMRLYVCHYFVAQTTNAQTRGTGSVWECAKSALKSNSIPDWCCCSWEWCRHRISRNAFRI